MAERRLQQLAARGFFVIPAGQLEWHADTGAWELAARIVGAAPCMVERQRIRAVGGKSFASSDRETPLHNDLQLYMGAPADLQVLACVAPAEQGGESLLLDSWPFLQDLEAREPELFAASFERVRRFPFVAGTVESTTVALFRERLAFLCSPQQAPADTLGQRLRREIDRAPPARTRLGSGDILVVDNHRTLHGRTMFTGGSRELIRLLIWLADEEPSRIPPRALTSRARPAPHAFAMSRCAQQRLDFVMRMLVGASPGALARKVPGGEAELYSMRDAALRAALRALDPEDRTGGGS